MDAQCRREDAEALSRHPSLKGFTVLAVDDNQDDLEFVRRALGGSAA